MFFLSYFALNIPVPFHLVKGTRKFSLAFPVRFCSHYSQQRNFLENVLNYLIKLFFNKCNDIPAHNFPFPSYIMLDRIVVQLSASQVVDKIC